MTTRNKYIIVGSLVGLVVNLLSTTITGTILVSYIMGLSALLDLILFGPQFFTIFFQTFSPFALTVLSCVFMSTWYGFLGFITYKIIVGLKEGKTKV